MKSTVPRTTAGRSAGRAAAERRSVETRFPEDAKRGLRAAATVGALASLAAESPRLEASGRLRGQVEASPRLAAAACSVEPVQCYRLLRGGKATGKGEFLPQRGEEREAFRLRMATEMAAMRETMARQERLPEERRDPSDLFAHPALKPNSHITEADFPPTRAHEDVERGSIGPVKRGDWERRLGKFVRRKAKEARALDQWNTTYKRPFPNADRQDSAGRPIEGTTARSQGLVHLIDYNFARPSKVEVSGSPDWLDDTKNPDLARTLRQADQAMLSKGQLVGHGRMTEKQFAELVDGGFLEEVRQEGRDSQGRNLGFSKPPGEPDRPWQELERRRKVAEQLRLSFDQSKKRFAGAIPAVDKKNSGALIKKWQTEGEGKGPFEAMEKAQRELAEMEAIVAPYRRYVLSRDESKKGRLPNLAKAGGMPIKPQKEILGAQRNLEAIVSGAPSNPTNTVSLDRQAPSRNLRMWQPTGDRTSPAKGKGVRKWQEQEVESGRLAPTLSADLRGVPGISSLKMWGVLDDTSQNRIPSKSQDKSQLAGERKKLKFSTVF